MSEVVANDLLQRNDELIVNMVKEAGELVKNFIELSKSDPFLRIITAILPTSAYKFLKSTKNYTPILQN